MKEWKSCSMVLAVVPAVVLEVAIAVARKILMAFTIVPVALLALEVVLDVVVLMAMAVPIVPLLLLLLLQLLLLPPSPLLVIEAAEVVIAVFVLFFSPCGQFSLHRTECWHGPVWVWNCTVNRTDLKFFRRQILWLEPFKINNNNKKLLDLWTECDNQPTDGTDETRINQEINTNRDDTKEKIEVRELFQL